MDKTAWVIGQGGIGTAVVSELKKNNIEVSLFSRQAENTTVAEHYYQCETDDPDAVLEVVQPLPTPDYVVIAAGMLQTESQKPEKTLKNLEPKHVLNAIHANVFPSIAFTKALQNTMAKKQHIRVCCFSARVGSISDNHLGGWHSYRMAKAALNMLVKNIALEWRRAFPNTIIYAYHPGTVKTNLSAPFSAHVQHDIFSPQQAAEYCINALMQVNIEQSGELLDWQQQCVQP